MPGGTAETVIRAVILDVDGIVLRSDHTIAPVTRGAVAQVIGLGVPVILASSRSPRGLAPVQAATGIGGHHLVAFQGALTGRFTGLDADDFEVLDELPMELPPARTIPRSSRISVRLGFGAREVIAFGDGDNDLGMFRYAGTTVAMGTPLRPSGRPPP